MMLSLYVTVTSSWVRIKPKIWQQTEPEEELLQHQRAQILHTAHAVLGLGLGRNQDLQSCAVLS